MLVNDLQTILAMVPVLVMGLLLVYVLFTQLLFKKLKGIRKLKHDPSMMPLNLVGINQESPEKNADPSVVDRSGSWKRGGF